MIQASHLVTVIGVLVAAAGTWAYVDHLRDRLTVVTTERDTAIAERQAAERAMVVLADEAAALVALYVMAGRSWRGPPIEIFSRKGPAQLNVLPEITIGQILAIVIPICITALGVWGAYLVFRTKTEGSLKAVSEQIIDTNKRLSDLAAGTLSANSELRDFKDHVNRHFVEKDEIADLRESVTARSTGCSRHLTWRRLPWATCAMQF